MKKWKGWIIEESLEDATVLSRLNIVSSMLERNEEGSKARTWHLNTVEVDNADIDRIAHELQQNIKSGWYAHFTDYKNLLRTLINQ